MDISARAATLGLAFPDVLLPNPTIDLQRWAVIACDQFTADRSYWESVSSFVGDDPSTLHLILPEVYLADGDEQKRRESINATMEQYRSDGTLRGTEQSAVYVRRSLADGTLRQGVVISVDLEAYDFSPDSSSMIRASEETIPSRLPARVDVRAAAGLESPHVLLLFEDPNNAVMTTLSSAADDLELLYDTPLMMGGGSITGYRVPAESATAEGVIEALENLDTFQRLGFRFATGDGNHSLAAAKKLWEERKQQGAAMDDPLRWCMVEAVNVYDPGLPFHPIHRLVEDPQESLLDALLHHTDARFHGFPVDRIAGHVAYEGLAPNEIAYVGPDQAGILTLEQDAGLPVALSDEAIEASHPGAIDYVHGFEEVITARELNDGVAIVLPEINRASLFSTVHRDGSLPRKAFSLGQARDKRYYLECRALR